MGSLIYAGSTVYEFDDRTLAHLQVVIVSRLRNRQQCLLSWDIEARAGAGRVSLSLHPDVPLAFHYRRAERVELNRNWLQSLADSANTPRGMILVAEESVEATDGAVPTAVKA